MGVLTADLMDLGRELTTIEEAGVGVIHLDVMDGVFCPMMTVGPAFIKGLHTSMLKDVHLMVHDPIPKLAEYVAAGADLLTRARGIYRSYPPCASGTREAWDARPARTASGEGCGPQSRHAA